MSVPYPAPPGPYAPPPASPYPPYGYYPPPRYATFGTILSDAFDVYAKNFGAFFVVYLILGAVLSTISVLLTDYLGAIVVGAIPTDPSAPIDVNAIFGALGALVGIAVLVWILTFIITSVVAGGMTQFAIVRHREQPADVSSSISAGVRRLGSVMGASILYGLIAASPLLAAFAVILVGAFSLSLGLIAMGILLFIPLGIIAIFLYIALSLNIPPVMMENQGAVDALARSWALTKGYRLSLFGVFLVLVILETLIGGAAGLITDSVTDPYLGPAVAIIAQTFVYAITGSWILIAVAVAYDLIVRTPAWPAPAAPAYPTYPAYPAYPGYAPPQAPPAAPPPQTPPPGP